MEMINRMFAGLEAFVSNIFNFEFLGDKINRGIQKLIMFMITLVFFTFLLMYSIEAIDYLLFLFSGVIDFVVGLVTDALPADSIGSISGSPELLVNPDVPVTDTPTKSM